jgi:hypothetical protein
MFDFFRRYVGVGNMYQYDSENASLQWRYEEVTGD